MSTVFEEREPEGRRVPSQATPRLAPGRTVEQAPTIRPASPAGKDNPRWQETARCCEAIYVGTPDRHYRLDIDRNGQNVIFSPSGQRVFAANGLFPIHALLAGIESDRREAALYEAERAEEEGRV